MASILDLLEGSLIVHHGPQLSLEPYHVAVWLSVYSTDKSHP